MHLCDSRWWSTHAQNRSLPRRTMHALTTNVRVNQMSIDWTMVGAIASVATVATVLIAVIGLTKGKVSLSRIIGHLVAKAGSAYSRVTNIIITLCRKTTNRSKRVKQGLSLGWTLWRKTVKADIRLVKGQDSILKEKSATENERIGMAAIMLSRILKEDRYINNEVCKKVFADVRETDEIQFHMLCARIAEDIVTNQTAQIEDAGASYTLPWDPILERFLKESLDEVPTERPKGV